MPDHAIDHLLHKCKNKNPTNTEKEEFIFASKMKIFIKKNEIFSLPIEILHRIVQKYFIKIGKHEIEQQEQLNYEEMIDFLFKCLNKYGKVGSVLFNYLNFETSKIDVIKKLNEEYSDIFDFSMINSSLAKVTIELTNKISKIKEEYKSNISLMKEEIEKKEKEIENLKEIEKKRQEDFEIQQEQLKQKYLNGINELKNTMKNRIDAIEERFRIINEENEKNKLNSIIHNYRVLIFETMNMKQFNSLCEESKIFIINEIVNQEKHSENSEIKIHTNDENKELIDRILICKRLFKSMDDHLDKFILENMNMKLLTIFNQNIENLYQKGELIPMINSIMTYYDHLSIKIEYPSSLFDKILDIISKEKQKNEQNNAKISIILVINNNDYFNEYQSPNSIIDSIECRVEEIKDKSFYKYNHLSKITIQEGLFNIGKSAFEGCSFLSHITIPSSVTFIGNKAFNNCKSLSQIIIPQSLSSIGPYTFNGCSSLTQITIPSSVKEIGDDAFFNCLSISQVLFENPSNLTSIGVCCFRNCKSLKQISIPSSVISIGWGCFSHCSSLEQITLSSSVAIIKKYSFYSCSSLTKIIIPPSVTSIDYTAFMNCSSLKIAYVPLSINLDKNRIFPSEAEIIRI